MNLLEGLVKCGRLLFDLCFPRICAVCGVPLNYHEQHFCLECFADMPLTHFWTVQDNPAEKVFWGRCRIERVYSLFYYTDNWRRPVHLLKYDGYTPLGKYLGRMLGAKLLLHHNLSRFDYIIPVPLHWRKYLSRGYNQSEVIARGIKEGLSGRGKGGAPQIVPNLLRRKSFAASQTSKEREQRWNSVKDAYTINGHCKKRPPAGSHLLLVDDVLTTGATLEACASILVEQLGCRVSIATLAYVE